MRIKPVTIGIVLGTAALCATLGSLVTRMVTAPASSQAHHTGLTMAQEDAMNKGYHNSAAEPAPTQDGAQEPCTPYVAVPSQQTQMGDAHSGQGASAPLCPGGTVLFVQTLVHVNTEGHGKPNK